MPTLPLWLEPVERLLEAGGAVLVVLALVAVVVFAMAIERWWYYRISWRRARHELVRRWAARSDHRSWSARTLRHVWSAALVAKLRRPLPWIRLLVVLCPLLGLLGTVTGMITVFDSLSMSDTHQARAMADGVARATLPTLTGMAIAVVGMLFISRLEHVIRREDQRLHDRLARALEESDA
ncbi:MotA/TolQ/ExbB proton channel family protein [Halomonas aquamarina]|jgi:biopolymer transport protein ExbB|uniref:MotA/TolQ/ExbB proton channel family protein n=1 Tax=Halomonadaceae TaxID=28256 RepID=UPI000C3D1815|nr:MULTISPECIES: MotA/TolQ/ExbB proton channel family protein [Halomonas]MAM03011.1 flagellar motor protein MotA [Halomonas sp.]MCP1319207.1 MotA/TolQ/ExbB proton channel family protein [Halomonas sp. 707B3]MDC8441652.1 MotA/TolQ/ExbB proton channel family protein [Halomonas aquamarina]HBM43724.1 flagellar motor protein MotA [Halomonas sp.]HBP77513.1 flagellar motor protein MotA [Halomonas sp.]|tara:strand:+ start:2222 stop:2764 length:543 start_codon:yes stop_codon:yes gene_type:complete